MRFCAPVADGDGTRSAARAGAGASFLRRHRPYLLLGTLFAALIFAPRVLVGADDDAEIESRKQDLADVERRVSNLEQDMDRSRGRRKALLVELERRERDIAQLARSGHQLREMVLAQERALEELQGRLKAEQEALRRERAALGSLLRSAYALGRGDRIRMLLGQDDPNRLSRIMSYYGYFNRLRIERIEAVARQARRLEGLAQEAQEETARLSLLARKQDEMRAGLTAAQDERTALLASLEQTIATQAESIADLRAQARELSLLLEQLERRARALPEAELSQESLKQLRGHLAWPVAGAPLVSRYGSPKGDGAQRWDGVVLKAEEGAEVRAVHNGRVAYADWLRGFGLLLIIEHEDGYMTLYGHNQALLKEPGEWVAAGDTVALSGSSGGRAKPGLYFAIRHRGRALNPEQWCRHDVGLVPESSARTPRHWKAAVSRCSGAGPLPTALGDQVPGSVAGLRIHVPVTSL